MEVEIWSRGLLVFSAVILGFLYLTINTKVGEWYQKITSFFCLIGCLFIGSWSLISLAAKVLK